MLKKSYLLITLNLVLLLIAVILLQKTKSLQAPKKMNVVLISVDTLRPDHIGIYGYHENTTPNIDQFFKNSYQFTNVYTSTPKTYASMVSIMTGLESSKTGIFDYIGRPLRNNEITLAQILKANGYTSAAYVINGALYSNGKQRSKLDKGFNKAKYLFASESDNNKSFYYYHQDQLKFVKNSLNFLENNQNNKFFLWFHFIDPHAPYAPYSSKINPKNKKDVEKIRNNYRGFPNGCANYNHIDSKTINKLTNLYDQEIAYTDMLIGKILIKLNKLELTDSTLVILTADHGEGFDHHYFFHHGNLYQSNIKIPLLIHYPASNKPKTDNTFIHNTDLLPTILELLGINYQQNSFDGHSFASKINSNWLNAIFYQKNRYIYGYNHELNYFSINDGRYKYIYSKIDNCLATGKQEELYDLKNDPQEKNNLIDLLPHLKNKLQAELFNHLKNSRIGF